MKKTNAATGKKTRQPKSAIRKAKSISCLSKPVRKRVSFKVATGPSREVYLTGAFNNWNAKKNEMKEKRKGVYVTDILLNRGKHEYKFVIDGEWRADPACPDCAPNSCGFPNSIVTVS